MRPLPKFVPLGVVVALGAAGLQACDPTSISPVEVQVADVPRNTLRRGVVPDNANRDLEVRGRVSGHATVIPLSESEPRFRLETRASGPFSHLGLAEMHWVVPEVLVDRANRKATVLSGDWSGTVTAANGDQLVGRYSFRQSVLPIDAWGNIPLLADLVIISGTGRYEGATGTGVAMGAANVFTRRVSGELTGTVTLADHRP